MLETIILWFSILFGATLGVAAGVVVACAVGFVCAFAIVIVAAVFRACISIFSKGSLNSFSS